MASVYKKGSKIYISWYDPIEGRIKNKSTGLSYNSVNKRKAHQFAKEFQKALDERVEKAKSLGIKRSSLGYAVEHFYRNNSDKNERTINGYRIFFDKFSRRFDMAGSCAQITKLGCEDWLTSFRNSDYQQNTLFGITKILKKFLRFLFEYNYIPMFALNRDVTFKPEVKPILIFEEADLQKMLDGLKFKNSNFKTTFYLLLYTGLRPSDIFNLKVSDIDMNRNTIRYYSPKTKNHFVVPFHPDLKRILEQRMKEINTEHLLEYESASNIGRAFRRYLKQIGLENSNYNLRTFRKSFITFAHESGLDLATVSKLAGHFRITTTERYYNKLSLTKKSEELTKLKFPVANNKTEVETEVEIRLKR